MQEKTEKPTPKKRRDARKKGQVASSKEVVSCALISGIFLYFFAFGYTWVDSIKAMIALPSGFYQLPFHQALQLVFLGIGKLTLWLMGTLLIAVIVIGVLSNLLQFGPLLSFHPIKPEIKKINPIEGAKKIFSLKNLVEFLKSIIKITLLSVLIFWVIRGNLQDLLRLPDCGLDCVTPLFFHLLWQVAIVTIVAFIIVAVGDYFFQRFNHTKQLKMTKDEVKREYKDTEGNPEIKSHRKQIHRELLQGGMLADVKRSSVIVCNPTHYTIGIHYDFKRDATPRAGRLPVITLKGKGLVARRIKEIAAAEGIPMVENILLARALYASGEVDAFIPSEFIQPLAEVLKWVEQFNQMKYKHQ